MDRERAAAPTRVSAACPRVRSTLATSIHGACVSVACEVCVRACPPTTAPDALAPPPVAVECGRANYPHKIAFSVSRLKDNVLLYL